MSTIGGGVGLWRPGPLTDAGVVVVAALAAAGALIAAPVPVVAAAAVVAVAVVSRRALLVAAAVGLLAGSLAHQSWQGLTPLPPGPFTGTVTLVADPRPAFGGWRVDAGTGQGRVELSARGAAGGRLGSRAAGERVEVVGRLERLSDPTWAAPRHVRARLVAERVTPHDDGGPVVRGVNRLRELLLRGARSLPDDQRALFGGFVLGDDRGGSVVVADDFDGAGLSHLLVVSGQNVAFVLAVAAPLIKRLRLRGRFVATLAVLALFAALTRFEPSVLRATAMAGVAAVAVVLGRPVAGVRIFALAVTGLLLIDPLLVHSLGFRLSAAASAGIVVLARPLGRVLPGPAWLSAPLAVTLSAQAAVAPFLVPLFGPMPVAAIPANLLAGPVAGLVMMWGCTAGVVAGLLPGPLAAALHWPTRAGLWWVAGVARHAASAPLGAVGLGSIAVVAGALALAAVAGSRRRRALAGGAGLVAVAVLALPAVSAGGGAPLGLTELGGAELWRGSGTRPATVLVVPGNARADAVLAGLRQHRVASIDLAVLRSGGPKAADVLRIVGERVPVDVVWAPAASPAPDAEVPPGTRAVGGGLAVETTRTSDRLDVTVEVVGETTAGPSP